MWAACCNWFCLNGQPEEIQHRPQQGSRAQAYANAGYSSFPSPTGCEQNCKACGMHFSSSSLKVSGGPCCFWHLGHVVPFAQTHRRSGAVSCLAWWSRNGGTQVQISLCQKSSLVVHQWMALYSKPPSYYILQYSNSSFQLLMTCKKAPALAAPNNRQPLHACHMLHLERSILQALLKGKGQIRFPERDCSQDMTPQWRGPSLMGPGVVSTWCRRSFLADDMMTRRDCIGVGDSLTSQVL